MSNIVLTTINAKYIHSSLGLRYLFANMGELKQQTRIEEFTLNQRAEDIVEKLVEANATIVGFGVYIWNSKQTLEVIQLLKLVRPETIIILGGPEISFETTSQPLFKAADHVITGQADHAFREACSDILNKRSLTNLVSPLPISLETLTLPYAEYNEADIANRILYVEASRGCPFKCEFCLSSLDKTATAFDLEEFLNEMKLLLERGARHFKFVDRTFNLKIASSKRILEFFLDAIENEKLTLFLHFELIPDRLPDALKTLLPRFPEGSLQFEIGIQSFNPDVQERISRKQDHQRTCDNVRWLRSNTTAHIHSDLIFGLPGESLHSFGEGFDQLIQLNPQEIQVGILKRLRGTPIDRHTVPFDMRYQPEPPYRIVSNSSVEFKDVQRIVRFARYWDLIANSGRFPLTLPTLLGDEPFNRFLSLSDWIFSETGQTHKIALSKLFTLLYRALTEHLNQSEESASQVLQSDFQHNRLKGRPSFLTEQQLTNQKSASQANSDGKIAIDDAAVAEQAAKRQSRHNNPGLQPSN